MKEKGVSTLGGRKIWFDEDVNRLNADGRGKFLGEFSGEDSILVITKSGIFRTTSFDLSNHFEDDVEIIEKYRPGKIWSAAYYDGEQEYYYIKRFHIEETEKPTSFIGEHPDSRLIQIMEVEYPRLELRFGGKNKDRKPEIIEVAEFIGVKSYRAKGKRLSNYEVKVIEQLEPQKNETPPEEKGDEDREEEIAGRVPLEVDNSPQEEKDGEKKEKEQPGTTGKNQAAGKPGKKKKEEKPVQEKKQEKKEPSPPAATKKEPPAEKKKGDNKDNNGQMKLEL